MIVAAKEITQVKSRQRPPLSQQLLPICQAHFPRWSLATFNNAEITSLLIELTAVRMPSVECYCGGYFGSLYESDCDCSSRHGVAVESLVSYDSSSFYSGPFESERQITMAQFLSSRSLSETRMDGGLFLTTGDCKYSKFKHHVISLGYLRSIFRVFAVVRRFIDSRNIDNCIQDDTLTSFFKDSRSDVHFLIGTTVTGDLENPVGSIRFLSRRPDGGKGPFESLIYVKRDLVPGLLLMHADSSYDLSCLDGETKSLVRMNLRAAT